MPDHDPGRGDAEGPRPGETSLQARVDPGAVAASDLVKRDFNPEAPDVIWCGDITYLRTGQGWLFLATVIDLHSRRVIGWAVAGHMRTELVVNALKMAVATRGGTAAGVIFHSDSENEKVGFRAA